MVKFQRRQAPAVRIDGRWFGCVGLSSIDYGETLEEWYQSGEGFTVETQEIVIRIEGDIPSIVADNKVRISINFGGQWQGRSYWGERWLPLGPLDERENWKDSLRNTGYTIRG